MLVEENYVWQKPHACHRYTANHLLVVLHDNIMKMISISSTNYFYYLPQIISIICQIINQNRLNNKLFALGCVRNLTLVPKHNNHTFSLFQCTPTSTNTLWYLCQFDFVVKYLGTRRAHSFEEFWFGFSFFSQFVPFFNSAADFPPSEVKTATGRRGEERRDQAGVTI